MSDCCECPIAGICKRRGGITMPVAHHRRCQAGQHEAIDRFYAREPENAVTAEVSKRSKDRRKVARAALVREPVGAALKARIARLVAIKTSAGCNCNNLAADMDRWGIAGCESRREEIISHLVGNREMLIEALRADGNWWKTTFAEMLPDAALRAGAAWLLNNAIADVRALPKPVSRGRRNNRGVYTGWRSEADGPLVEMGPFESKLRHLTYFVYGKSRDSVQWNLEQLAKRWWLFNGKRIIGIASDAESMTSQQVIELADSLGMKFDVVLTAKNNPKLREVVLFKAMLSELHPEFSSSDEVVFSAHAKGQKYDDPKHTRDWTDLMYQSCLDDWPSVYNALRTSLMAGSFREYGLLGKWHNWAYSGTFVWWRLQAIGRRKWSDIDQWFAGTESWPGKMCLPQETACLFLNDSRRLYDAHYWTETVWPEWAKYQEAIRGR
jgi:hypothetical protein